MLDELKQMDEVFESSTVREPGTFEPLPDGKYQVIISECFFEQSKTSGRPQFKWVYRVISGPMEGRLIFHYRGLDTPDGVKYFKQELFTSGFDADGMKVRLSEIFQAPRMLDCILDTPLEVTLKSKKGNNGQEYQNLFINKRLEISEGTGGYNDEPVF